MDPNNLLIELKSLPGLIDAQVAAGLMRADVVEANYNSTLQKVSCLNSLGTNDIERLTRAVTNGVFSETQVKTLASTLMTHHCQTTSDTASKKRRDMQICMNFENFADQLDNSLH